MTEICRRLDAMPLAIGLAPAQVSSMDEIVGSLHERFGLLTGSTERAATETQT